MSERFGDNTPVVRVELKKADAAEIVRDDKVLRAAPLVTALGSNLAGVLSKAIVRRYPDKVVVFQQGESGSSLFFVLSGEVRLFARKDTDSVELGHAHKGEVAGEGEVLAGDGVRKASGVAQGSVDLAEIPREALVVGGALLPQVVKLLTQVRAVRTRALDELTDFVNRW